MSKSHKPAPHAAAKAVAEPKDAQMPMETPEEAATRAAAAVPQGDSASAGTTDAPNGAEAPQGAAQGPENGLLTAVAHLSSDEVAGIMQDLGEQVRAGLAELKAHMDSEFRQFADHFEMRLKNLDVAALESLVTGAKTALEAIAASGAAGLADRVGKIEMQIKHFV